MQLMLVDPIAIALSLMFIVFQVSHPATRSCCFRFWGTHHALATDATCDFGIVTHTRHEGWARGMGRRRPDARDDPHPIQGGPPYRLGQDPNAPEFGPSGEADRRDYRRTHQMCPFLLPMIDAAALDEPITGVVAFEHVPGSSDRHDPTRP